MRMPRKFFFTGITVALLMSVVTSSTCANRLSISSQQLRMTWLQVEIKPGLSGIIRCPLTMEGSFHSATIRKVRGALIGQISRATVGPIACREGSVTISQEALPWHIRYRGFRGRLPDVVGIDQEIIGAKFALELGCTTGTSLAHPWILIASLGAGGAISGGLSFDEANRIPLRGSYVCMLAGEAQYAGTARVVMPGTTTVVSVTLI